MKLSLNPFCIFKPSPVAQKILDDLDKYPITTWLRKSASPLTLATLLANPFESYTHSALSYSIRFCWYNDHYYISDSDLNLTCFDFWRINSKCKSQAQAAARLRNEKLQAKAAARILET